MEPLKVNQVWKPKDWYSGGYVVTAVGKKVASLKVDGDPDAKDDLYLLFSDLPEFLRNCELQPYPPSFPVKVKP